MFTYQFNFFFNHVVVDAKPENIPELMGHFNNSFLPSFFEEPSALGVRKVIRMNGIGDMEGVMVIFGAEILSIQINDSSEEIKDKDLIFNKLRYVTDCLGKIEEIGKSHRIATIITSVLPARKDVVFKTYETFFKENADENVFEWNGRKVTRIDLKGHSLNFVKSVNRMTFVNSDGGTPKPFDGVLIEFDVNTPHENNTPRFEVTDIDFVSELHDIARREFISFISAV